MDKNDLYNAFDKIDPALVTRSEEGNCFAKKKAKRSFAEKRAGKDDHTAYYCPAGSDSRDRGNIRHII